MIKLMERKIGNRVFVFSMLTLGLMKRKGLISKLNTVASIEQMAVDSKTIPDEALDGVLAVLAATASYGLAVKTGKHDSTITADDLLNAVDDMPFDEASLVLMGVFGEIVSGSGFTKKEVPEDSLAITEGELLGEDQSL